MKVKELIELLQKEDPNRLVIIQKDAEGNEHSPLENFWAGAYQAETTYSGRAGLQKLTDADRAAGYSEEDVVEGAPALVLVPVN